MYMCTLAIRTTIKSVDTGILIRIHKLSKKSVESLKIDEIRMKSY